MSSGSGTIGPDSGTNPEVGYKLICSRNASAGMTLADASAVIRVASRGMTSLSSPVNM